MLIPAAGFAIKFLLAIDATSSNWTTALTNFMAAITNGTAPAGTVIDGEAIGSTGGVPAPFGSLLNKDNETGDAPKAYLNYLVFDRNYKVLDGGFVRVTEAAKESGADGNHEKLAKEIEIKEAGYVYFYLSNDNVALGGSAVEVYFDDFKVEHTKSPVIQTDDYYPFGLTFNSYQRENSAPNDYKFGNKEEQTELGLSTIDFGWRQYDPAIGRWSVIDQWSEKENTTSPYTFVMDNPISRREIDGRYFVGEDGEKVKIKVKRDGTVKVKGGNASADLVRMAGMVGESGSKTARKTFNQLAKNDTKINFKIVSAPVDNGLLGLHQAHDANGTALHWQAGADGTGRFEGNPAYITGKNGKAAYKEASITVFEGNFDQGQINAQRRRSRDEQLSKNEMMVATFSHEGYHDTDQKTIDAIKTRQEGGTNSYDVETAAEDNAENKVYQEVKANRGN